MTAPVDLAAYREARLPENQYAYTCACGGQTFTLRPDAKLQCSQCDVVAPRLIWGQYFVSAVLNPPDQT